MLASYLFVVINQSFVAGFIDRDSVAHAHNLLKLIRDNSRERIVYQASGERAVLIH